MVPDSVMGYPPDVALRFAYIIYYEFGESLYIIYYEFGESLYIVYYDFGESLYIIYYEFGEPKLVPASVRGYPPDVALRFAVWVYDS